MTLAPGTKLGPYEILGALGAGGMGEVYRAKDTRLGREVAIKVLPQHLSAEPEVRARFEREAKTVSSLNHPNICTLFDVGQAPAAGGTGETDYLVMELIEGETLAERLRRGALPAADVLRLGGQIADALDRAHRAGIVHRDLKPGNVMLTRSGAKLMDFGLARATGLAGPAGASGAPHGALTQSPTVARALTAEGTIVGTFQYMPPEQLEGGEADARSDLWAFGCVLYEMATGRRAFDGRSQASLISAIMKEQPAPPSQLSPASPPALDRLVARCLAKDPDDRWQTARDLVLELRALAGDATSAASAVSAAEAVRPVPRRASVLPWAVAAVSLAVAAALGVLLFARARAPREPVQLSLLATPGAKFSPYNMNKAISPDGRSFAYCARDSDGTWGLFVRSLAEAGGDRRVYAGNSAMSIAWSPDSRSLAAALLDGGSVVVVSATGGAPTSLTDVGGARGIAWGSRGVLLLAPHASGPIMAVGADGNGLAQATWPDSSRHENGHRFPCFLPDGKHFLFAALPEGPHGFAIWAGELGSRRVKRVFDAGSAPVWAAPGWLLYRRANQLVAQRFDARALEVRGQPFVLAELRPPSDLTAEPVASASLDGRLTLLEPRPGDQQLEWFGLDGRSLGVLPVQAGRWSLPRISPDGRSALAGADGDLWRIDLDRAVASRLTNDGTLGLGSVWSPDGARIAAPLGRGRTEIMVLNADGSGTPRALVTTDDTFKNAESWARGGLVIQTIAARTFRDQWLVDPDGGAAPRPLLRSSFIESGGRVSPDGRWLAYLSNEAGSQDVYVQAFPGLGHKVRVTSDGARTHWWTPKGDALLYIPSVGSTLMRVPVVRAGDALVPGRPERLGDFPAETFGADLAPDGRRMLVAVPRAGGPPATMRVILDWPALLKK